MPVTDGLLRRRHSVDGRWADLAALRTLGLFRASSASCGFSMSASSSQVPEVTCARMLPFDLKEAFLGRTCRLGPSVLERCNGGIAAGAACGWPEAVITPIEAFTHLLCTLPLFDVGPCPQTPERRQKAVVILLCMLQYILVYFEAEHYVGALQQRHGCSLCSCPKSGDGNIDVKKALSLLEPLAACNGCMLRALYAARGRCITAAD